MKNKKGNIVTAKISPQGNLFEAKATKVSSEHRHVIIYKLESPHNKSNTYRRIISLSNHLFEK